MLLDKDRYRPAPFEPSAERLAEVAARVRRALEGATLSPPQVGGAERDEVWSLVRDEDLWAVYFRERGVRKQAAFFVEFEEAVKYLVWEHILPPSIDWVGTPFP